MRLIGHTSVVSLRHRSDRRTAFEQTACSIELEDWCFVDGFDGAAMGLSTSVGKSYRQLHTTSMPMSAGEIGCYLTHLGIVRNALGMKQRTITVIEDDVRFKPDFNEKWTAFLRDVPNDWQLLHLSVNASRFSDSIPITDHVERVTGAWGNYFYVMRESAMQYVSRYADMTYPIDVLTVEVMRRLPAYRSVEDLIELTDAPTDCGKDTP